MFAYLQVGQCRELFVVAIVSCMNVLHAYIVFNKLYPTHIVFSEFIFIFYFRIITIPPTKPKKGL